jgi:hypothetical protein
MLMEQVSDSNNSLRNRRANNPIYQASHFIAQEGIRMAERAKKNPYGILQDENK